MENINTRYGFRSPYVKDGDPLYPCEIVQVRDRRSCYNRTSARAFDLNHHDYAATVKMCDRVAAPWRQSCFRGLGRDVAVDADFAPKPIIAHCALAAAHAGDCLFGAGRTIGDTYAASGEKRAETLCNGAPRAERDACFAGFGIVLGLLEPTNATRARACARVAKEHAATCTETAIAEVDPSGRWAWG
jgi:hypothetical protein